MRRCWFEHLTLSKRVNELLSPNSKWFWISCSWLIQINCPLETRGAAGHLVTGTCNGRSVRAQRHDRRQQRDEVPGLSSGACDGGIQQDFGKSRRVSDRAVVVRLEAHELSETLPEPCGEQTVDDGIDRRAEVEEDARQDVDVLINIVHQVGPLADGTPQEPLDVKGRPADAEHSHHDR